MRTEARSRGGAGAAAACWRCCRRLKKGNFSSLFFPPCSMGKAWLHWGGGRGFLCRRFLLVDAREGAGRLPCCFVDAPACLRRWDACLLNERALGPHLTPSLLCSWVASGGRQFFSLLQLPRCRFRFRLSLPRAALSFNVALCSADRIVVCSVATSLSSCPLRAVA